MDALAVTLFNATPVHFDAIVRIERAIGGSSAVAIGGAATLEHAHERGHWLTVALDRDEVAGWAWFTIDIDRGGEYAGQLLRIAVDPSQQRRGIGRALLDHVRATMRERECARISLTLDAADDAARAFFVANGLAVDSLAMGQPL